MKRLTMRQRQQRMKENLEEAWVASRRPNLDPGLREIYDNIQRAPIRLICCQMEKSVNQGGILRTAEAFRLEQVDYEPEEDRASDFTGSMGSRSWQPMRWISAKEAIIEAKKSGYTIYGLTLREDSVALESVDWKFPAALVLGKEKEGLPKELEDLCDVCIGIPMYGMITSLNVSASCAILVHQMVVGYKKVNPDFEPVRNLSRRLVGLAELDYSSSEH